MKRVLRSPFSFVLLLLIAGILATCAQAHDIPARMEMQGYVKRQPDRLEVLMRLPLALMLNVNLPKRGPGYLDLEGIGPDLERAAEIVARELPFYEDGERLAPAWHRVQLAQPSSGAFESFEQARAHIAGELPPPQTPIFWNQGYFDIHLTYPLRSERSVIAYELVIAPGLAGQLKVVLQFDSSDGGANSYVLHHGMGRVALNPGVGEVARLFGGLGFGAPLYSLFHLVFLSCLAIPYRRIEPERLGRVVAVFAVTHAVTLSYVVAGGGSVTREMDGLIEFAIAALVLCLAIHNAVGRRLDRRWVIAALAGPLFGLQLVTDLQSDMQLNGGYLGTSLLAFNLGVMAAFLAVLAIVVPLLALLHRTRRTGRYTVISSSLLIGHASWHWAVERLDFLRRNWNLIHAGADPGDLAFSVFFFLLAAMVLFVAYRTARRLRLGRSP